MAMSRKSPPPEGLPDPPALGIPQPGPASRDFPLPPHTWHASATGLGVRSSASVPSLLWRGEGAIPGVVLPGTIRMPPAPVIAVAATSAMDPCSLRWPILLRPITIRITPHIYRWRSILHAHPCSNYRHHSSIGGCVDHPDLREVRVIPSRSSRHTFRRISHVALPPSCYRRSKARCRSAWQGARRPGIVTALELRRVASDSLHLRSTLHVRRRYCLRRR
jgi:hypothetical protein